MSTPTETPNLSGLRINRGNSDPEGRKGLLTKVIATVVIVAILGIAYFFLQRALAPIPEVEVATASLTFPSQANAVLTASGYVVAQRKAAVASNWPSASIEMTESLAAGQRTISVFRSTSNADSSTK